MIYAWSMDVDEQVCAVSSSTSNPLYPRKIHILYICLSIKRTPGENNLECPLTTTGGSAQETGGVEEAGEGLKRMIS